MSDQISELLKRAKNKENQPFAKLLSAVERLSFANLSPLKPLFEAPPHCFRVGITGPPGAGKSSLVSAMIEILRQHNFRVGVLAVDPTSPFSQGAILGDRIRLSQHFTDDNVFIRSLGSRGDAGGMAVVTYFLARAFDFAEFDFLLIETVGVGQTELEIMNVADAVSVVLVPESGDSIQAMKAGLLEIAQHFVINKADRQGAEGFRHELESSLSLLSSENLPSIFMTSATQNQGIDAWVNYLLDLKRNKSWIKNRSQSKRLRGEWSSFSRHLVESKLQEQNISLKDQDDLFTSLNQLQDTISKCFTSDSK